MNEATQALSEEERLNHVDLLVEAARGLNEPFDRPKDTKGVILMRDVFGPYTPKGHVSEWIGFMKGQYMEAKALFLKAFEESTYRDTHDILGWEVLISSDVNLLTNQWAQNSVFLGVQAILVEKDFK